MTSLALDPTYTADSAETSIDRQWRMLCRAGGVAALIQLGCLFVTIIVAILVGPEPTTAQEYFDVLRNDGLAGLLRLDFATLLLICLFSLVTFGIFAAFRKTYPAYAALAGAGVFVGMVLALANHSAFSMMRLSELHATATTLAQQEQWLTAGEAVIATDMWNTTAGFLAGIFMQGAFVFISLVMWRSKEFGRSTAITGLLANGLDLLHVFVMLWAPATAMMLLSIGGLFYVAWFPLLGWDLLKLGSSPRAGNEQEDVR